MMPAGRDRDSPCIPGCCYSKGKIKPGFDKERRHPSSGAADDGADNMVNARESPQVYG
jgi:hypothetical protein